MNFLCIYKKSVPCKVVSTIQPQQGQGQHQRPEIFKKSKEKNVEKELKTPFRDLPPSFKSPEDQRPLKLSIHIDRRHLDSSPSFGSPERPVQLAIHLENRRQVSSVEPMPAPLAEDEMYSSDSSELY